MTKASFVILLFPTLGSLYQRIYFHFISLDLETKSLLSFPHRSKTCVISLICVSLFDFAFTINYIPVGSGTCSRCSALLWCTVETIKPGGHPCLSSLPPPASASLLSAHYSVNNRPIKSSFIITLFTFPDCLIVPLTVSTMRVILSTCVKCHPCWECGK